MKETYEKIISIITNRICIIIAFFAILPIAIAQLFGMYLLYMFFKLEGIEIEQHVFQIIGIGNACLLFVLLILFTHIMEGFDKELKKLYHQIKNRKKQPSSGDKKP